MPTFDRPMTAAELNRWWQGENQRAINHRRDEFLLGEPDWLQHLQHQLINGDIWPEQFEAALDDWLSR